MEIVRNAGLIPSVEYGYMSDTGVGYGEVYDMSPQAEQRIEEGSIITLWVLEEEEETDEQTLPRPERLLLLAVGRLLKM